MTIFQPGSDLRRETADPEQPTHDTALSSGTVDYRVHERPDDPRRRHDDPTSEIASEANQARAPPDDGPLLPARAVWERYGVTSMSLHRWVREPNLNFPRPVYIGRFRYFKLQEILDWERSRPRENPQHAAA